MGIRSQNGDLAILTHKELCEWKTFGLAQPMIQGLNNGEVQNTFSLFKYMGSIS